MMDMMMDLFGLVDDALSEDDDASSYDEYFDSVRILRSDGLRRRPLYGSPGNISHKTDHVSIVSVEVKMQMATGKACSCTFCSTETRRQHRNII